MDRILHTIRDLHLGGPPRLYNFMDGIDGLAGGAMASSFFFLVFAYSAGPAVRIALVVFVTVGIACGGLWVWGKERPQNRDVHGDHRTPSEQGQT